MNFSPKVSYLLLQVKGSEDNYELTRYYLISHNMCFSKILFLPLTLFFQVKSIEILTFTLHKDNSLPLKFFYCNDVIFSALGNILSQQWVQIINFSYEWRFSILFLMHFNMLISTVFLLQTQLKQICKSLSRQYEALNSSKSLAAWFLTTLVQTLVAG